MHTNTIDNTDVQKLLHGWRDGDQRARDMLFERLYIELRKLSSSILRGEGQISLTTGDLVNEAVMRLIGLKHIDWQDKAHFMALASRMMRRVLVEHARKKHANKREHQKVTLVTQVAGASVERMDNQLLEHALIRLQALDKERAEIVEMRYYGGLSLEEIAEVIGKSPSTVKRNWRSSRAWLVQAISESRPN